MYRILLISFRNITGQRIQSLATALGVSFSVLLISVLLGLYSGWSTQVTQFLGAIEADIWIGQKGSTNISRTVSFIPKDMEGRIEQVSGVASVTPFVSGQVEFESNDASNYLLLVGGDNTIIKPYEIIEGRAELAEGELIIDRGLVVQEGLAIGDVVTVNGRNLTIVGISTGGNLLFSTFGLALMSEVERVLNQNAFISYLIVNTTPEQTVEEVKGRLQATFPDLEVMTQGEFVSNNAEIVRDAFLPIIAVLTIITFISGVLIIGLMIYTATIEQRHEYGVLKALGYSNRELFLVAIIQSIFASITGLGLATFFLGLILGYVPDVVSGFIIYLGRREVGIILVSTFVMGFLASFLPFSKIVEIDPANVFKS